ncbi:MAG: DUF2608 domain-containing protein [Parachlamydiaceae bacterium]
MCVPSLGQIFANDAIEVTDVSILFEVSNQNTLILTDISDTLYKPCNTISDKKWRTYLAGRVHEIVLDPTLVSKIANSIENIIVNQVDKKLVHKNTPSVIKELQSRGIPLIAISLKNWAAPYDPNFGTTTSNHLKKLGIDLEQSIPLLGKMQIDGSSSFELVQEVNATDEYTFAKGIIFTNKKPLDNALDAFLNRLEKKPAQIVILENSYEHKEKLARVIKAHNIGLTFIKHQPSEHQENAFDPTLGTIEFLRFMEDSRTILDEEAQRIKENSTAVDFEALLKDYITKVYTAEEK